MAANPLDSPDKLIQALSALRFPVTYTDLKAHFGSPQPSKSHYPEFNPETREQLLDPKAYWIWREHIRLKAPGRLNEDASFQTNGMGTLNLTVNLTSKEPGVVVFSPYTLRINSLVNRNHFFLRPSITEVGKVEYIADASAGARDRRVISSMAKFLTKFFSEQLPDHHIRDVNAAFTAQFSAEDVLFAVTEEEWLHAYHDGSAGGSCMAKGLQVLNSHVMPITVYAGSPGIKCAYLKEGNKVTARSVVWEPEGRQKIYVRVFGNPRLEHKLQMLGYAKGNLMGARLRRVPAIDKNNNNQVVPNTFVVPYIDDRTAQSAQTVYADPKDPTMFIIGRDGTTPDGVQLNHRTMEHYPATSANGLVGLYANICCHTLRGAQRNRIAQPMQAGAPPPPGHTVCGSCLHAYPSGGVVISGNFQPIALCEECRVNHYQRAWYLGNRDMVHRRTSVLIAGGERYVNDPMNMVHYDLVQLSSEYYDNRACRRDTAVRGARGEWIMADHADELFGRTYHHDHALTFCNTRVPHSFNLEAANAFRYLLSADEQWLLIVRRQRSQNLGLTYEQFISHWLSPAARLTPALRLEKGRITDAISLTRFILALSALGNQFVSIRGELDIGSGSPGEGGSSGAFDQLNADRPRENRNDTASARDILRYWADSLVRQLREQLAHPDGTWLTTPELEWLHRTVEEARHSNQPEQMRIAA